MIGRKTLNFGPIPPPVTSRTTKIDSVTTVSLSRICPQRKGMEMSALLEVNDSSKHRDLCASIEIEMIHMEISRTSRRQCI